MPATRVHLLALLLAAALSAGLLCLARRLLRALGRTRWRGVQLQPRGADSGASPRRPQRGWVLGMSYSGVGDVVEQGTSWMSHDWTGFYKVTMNDSSLWFQLCDQMIFNFDQPVCLDCKDCGGPLRCGNQCSALVSTNIGGYDVCTTIGSASGSHMYLIDDGNPQKGVVVKMSSSKCSISVFVFCDSSVAQVSDKFSQSGSCDYATILRHPSGCARSVSASGNGWGWLGTSFITILCILVVYILIGAIYRYYFLGIHSVEAIPNLELWIRLLQKIKTPQCVGAFSNQHWSVFVPLTRRTRGYVRDSRGLYSPVNH